MTTILLIDDDERLATALREYLARYDLSLLSANRPDKGLKILAQDPIDLVILDIMLPEQDGFEVCRTIRKTSDIPIVMLTARGEVMDRVVGLELGADDYLPKPFEPRELVARIQNVLKRSKPSKSNTSVLNFELLEINQDLRQVKIDGHGIDLTTLEYQLLTLLAQSPGKNFSRDEILNRLRGVESDIYSRSVDILVSRLRKKLIPTQFIKTVWGCGYCFIPRSCE